MPTYPPRIKRLLREYAAQAYEAELNQVLEALAQQFTAWQTGQLSASDLTQHIHNFHRGPARELWNRYNAGIDDMHVAYALVTGLLKRDELPAELLEHLQNAIAFYERD